MIKIHNDGKEKATSFAATIELTYTLYPSCGSINVRSFGSNEIDAVINLRNALFYLTDKTLSINYSERVKVDWAGKELK